MADINFKTHMTMKQQSFLLRAVAFMVALACALGAGAYSFQTGGIYYNVTSQPNRTVEVTYMDASYYSLGAYDGNITIPGTVTYNGYIYTVTRIGDRAFYNADGLTSLTIPSTVLSIGELAFCWQEDHYCNRLTSITIPNSVQTIANEAFRKCYALRTVVIGDGVTSIGESAFAKCINLTNLTIGSSVTSIGADAFWGAGYDPDDSSSNASGLTITSKAVNPPTIQSSTFPSKTYSYATLKVPLGSKSAYQSANYWRNFSYIQEFYSLEQALNVSGGNITFLSAGDYPWITLQGSGRVYAQSGNAGVSSSTSEMTATVSVARTSTLSFDFKAWGEGSNYDVCRFLIDGVEQFKYGARDNDWETYSVDLSAGSHTLTWSYSKDGSVNPTGDYFAVDNVAITAKTEAYACYTSSNKTLTFYYDNQRASRSGTTYDLNTGTSNPGWYTDGTRANVTNVVFNSSFANARPTSTRNWFCSMENLQSITGISYLNTSEVTSMMNMFRGCEQLASLDVSHFNTAKVTTMSCMFCNCSSLTSLGVSGFNTSQVTNMTDMFYGCSGLTSLDLRGFNTSKVTNMNAMFKGCSSLASLDLSSFNTSQVTDMTGMFYDCSGLTRLDLSSFNTAKVTDMSEMFYRCSGLTGLDLSGFSTSKVTNMKDMFYYCSGLTSLDVSHFNTANVTSMKRMFCGCSNLSSLNLSSFNTAKVTDMYCMFNSCSNLTTVYVSEDWSTEAVTTSYYMFDSSTHLVGGQGTTWDASNPKDKTYAHIDGGPSNPGYFTEWKEAYACYTSSNRTLTFYYDNQRSSRSGTTYDLNTGDDYPGWYSDNTMNNVTKVVFDPSFADAKPTTTCAWFRDMTRLQTITGLYYLNTSQVTSMKGMFAWCDSLQSVDVSSFNTANVTDMIAMFACCEQLSSLNLSHFSTSNVTLMSNMFVGCHQLTSLDVSSFNTDKVTNMYAMFGDCPELTSLNLSGFNTAMVTDMSLMFHDCSQLQTIYVGDGWSTAAVANSSNMFKNCTSLVGGMGTTYDASHVDATYARIDGGPSNPGYFTAKGGTALRGDVNGNNEVTIADVSALIDYLLTGDTTGINMAAADCNGIDGVTLADVSALIDYLLTGNW